MLAAEFEAGETSRPQRVPQFFFLLRLFASETPGVCSGIHAAKRRKTTLKHKTLSPSLSPLVSSRGGNEPSSGAFVTPSPPSEAGGEGRGEEVRFLVGPLADLLSGR